MNLKITLSGGLGSGKTLLRSNLIKEYGFIPYSTGEKLRELAEQRGMSILEMNKYAETHPEIDQYIDDGLCELSKSSEKYIIDSRLAWHFVRPSFKIYLKIDPLLAAKRIMDSNERETEVYRTIGEAADSLTERLNSENSRFVEKYGVDCMDMANYDFILDTTNLTPQQVLLEVIKKYDLENK